MKLPTNQPDKREWVSLLLNHLRTSNNAKVVWMVQRIATVLCGNTFLWLHQYAISHLAKKTLLLQEIGRHCLVLQLTEIFHSRERSSHRSYGTTKNPILHVLKAHQTRAQSLAAFWSPPMFLNQMKAKQCHARTRMCSKLMKVARS